MDGDQPRVRAFLMLFANENGFYFTTGKQKKVYKQLTINPKVEVCFYSPSSNKMMRVTGEVEFIDDMELKTKIFEERDYLKAIVKTPDNPMFVIFRINKGYALWTTMETNLMPPEIIEF